MDDSIVYTFLPKDFPLDDVASIGAALERSGTLIAGYRPPQVGLLSIPALIYARQIDGLAAVLLPDRNLISRMAKIARTGSAGPMDLPTVAATQIMAFAQALDLLIEPSIAFHELAQVQGNQKAHEELAWFRSADRGNAMAWIDLAVGRRATFEVGQAAQISDEDLAKPLRRWNRNYIAALKIAELELDTRLSPVDRAIALYSWMRKDFIIAGPAAIFAAMYFSPCASRRGLMKQLKSANREKALVGIRNAAWDITQLSDFLERAQRGVTEKKQYIFATADRALATIAPLLLTSRDGSLGQPALADVLQGWWPRRGAVIIADSLFAILDTIETRTTTTWPPRSIEAMIAAGEHTIRTWKP